MYFVQCGYPTMFESKYNISDDLNAIRFIPVTVPFVSTLHGVQIAISS